jgi:hypothetical protein
VHPARNACHEAIERRKLAGVDDPGVKRLAGLVALAATMFALGAFVWNIYDDPEEQGGSCGTIPGTAFIA